MGNLKGIVPCEMGAILSCYPALILKPQQGSPRVMLSCIPCPARQRSEEGKPVSPFMSSAGYLTIVALSHFVKWALGPAPPFIRQIFAFKQRRKARGLAPGPGADPPLGPMRFACPPTSVPLPPSRRHLEGGDLLPTVTGLWDSDCLAYRFMV